MAIKEKSKNRIIAGNISLLSCLVMLTTMCWHEYAWYELFAPYATLITFVFLGIALVCYVDVKEALSDRYFWLLVATLAVTLINILIIHSGIGAFFTVADLMLVLYLSDKIKLSAKEMTGVVVYLAFFFYYWTFDVKGYFKGYNTNYGGLVLITGFAFAMVMLVYFREILLQKGRKKTAVAVYAFSVFMFAWGYNIISWYRARCALLGLIIIVILMLIPKRAWTVKWLYNLLCVGITLGAVVISWIYIGLGKIKDVFTIQVFYKDILSGRDEIWTELWTEFLKHPLTGIGSNYEMKLDWMGGMFEVHNGLLDILIVHGVIVFAVVLFMMIKVLLSIRSSVCESKISATAMAGVMAILGASFMENFFIVPPFLLCFLLLVITCREHFYLV